MRTKKSGRRSRTSQTDDSLLVSAIELRPVYNGVLVRMPKSRGVATEDLFSNLRGPTTDRPNALSLNQGGDGKSSDGGARVGLTGSMVNLANAAIGAGVLAFPRAFALSGIVLGPLLALFFAVLVRLLAAAAAVLLLLLSVADVRQ